ncbi:hypothetical protein ACEQ8H_001079 [Pleosporales sp. CAS-2024a]
MLRTRFPGRAATASPQTCLRWFSSAPPKQNDGLISILNSSDAAQRPGESAASTSLAARLARDAGLDRISPSREMIESERRDLFQRQIFRDWRLGDVYSPSDLTGTEQKRWKLSRKQPQSDAFDVLGINPVMEYKNFTMMSEFMSETGRIKPRQATGLRPKNQRKIAKAIRRAIGLGLMSSVHRHPLVLKKSHPGRFL